MKISYTENILKVIEPDVTSSDSLINLSADIDATFVGVLLLSNGVKKIMNFVSCDSYYQARLVICEDELPSLLNSKFYIFICAEDMQKKSNVVKFNFKNELIKKDVKLAVSNEIEKLSINLKQLELTVDSLCKGHVIENLNIQNKDYIQKGMIPVAIDSKGNCVMQFPFSNHVTKVNGQVAADGIVEIDASMIKYHLDKTIKSALDQHAAALETLANALKEISNNLLSINEHLNEVDMQITQHINNGIV